MSTTEISQERSICTRKERRFKANDDGDLKCETTLADCGLRRGTVIDLSPSGVRLLCEGNFEPGQAIFTELTTSRSHGIYRGEIRRVEPWTGGQSILGCALVDKIPEEVLQELANEGALNRRTDNRVDLEGRKAKVSWPLNPDEVDAELHDFSEGGMKIVTSASIPHNNRLRFRIENDGDQPLVVEVRPVWLEQDEEGKYVAGVAFTGRDDSQVVADRLGLHSEPSPDPEPCDEIEPQQRRVRGILCAAAIATACYFFV